MRARDPRKRMLARAKHLASKYGVPFDMTIDDITIPKRCPVLGIELQGTAVRRGGRSPSLARLVSSLGYVSGNVLVMSLRANELKADASLDEMVRVAGFFTAMKMQALGDTAGALKVA